MQDDKFNAFMEPYEDTEHRLRRMQALTHASFKMLLDFRSENPGSDDLEAVSALLDLMEEQVDTALKSHEREHELALAMSGKVFKSAA